MYNPYDLMQVYVDGVPIDGRPFEFDSEITNQKTMCNNTGDVVKPTKLSTVCPSCGGGMVIDLPALPDPPFQPVIWSCIVCNPPAVPIPDPFINPVDGGRIKETELDNMVREDIKISDKLVADRIDLKQILEEPKKEPESKEEPEPKIEKKVPEDFSFESKKTKASDPPKSSKIKEKPEKKPERIVETEPVEDIGPEVEYDDSDLIEE